jgi:programmed cell death 6-interacting protein
MHRQWLPFVRYASPEAFVRFRLVLGHEGVAGCAIAQSEVAVGVLWLFQIQQKMSASAVKLENMTLEGASGSMPRLQAPMMSVDDMEPATVVAALRTGLQQLDTIGAHRAGLEESLKEMKTKDDILPKLMASSDDHDALFAKEIAKYQPIKELVEKNCAAQVGSLLVLPPL